jgi:hypothetical protein
MMKMRREDFYEKLWKETAGKPGFNPEFVNQTNKDNVAKKREYLSMLYDYLSVSEEKYGIRHKRVEDCPDEVVHNAFRSIFGDMLKYKKKGLASKLEPTQTAQKESQLELNLSYSDPKAFERHLAALDGYPLNKNPDYPSFEH